MYRTTITVLPLIPIAILLVQNSVKVTSQLGRQDVVLDRETKVESFVSWNNTVCDSRIVSIASSIDRLQEPQILPNLCQGFKMNASRWFTQYLPRNCWTRALRVCQCLKTVHSIRSMRLSKKMLPGVLTKLTTLWTTCKNGGISQDTNCRKHWRFLANRLQNF